MRTEEKLMKELESIDMDLEDTLPVVGSSLLKPTMACDKYKVQIYVTLHDAIDEPDRKRWTLSIEEKTESKARKKQFELVTRAKLAISEAFKKSYKHDFLNAMENWLESLKCRLDSSIKGRKNLEYSTYDGYMDKFKLIKAYFEHHPIDIEDITKVTIEEFRDWALYYGRVKPLKNPETGQLEYGLSVRTVKDTVRLMHNFFENQKYVKHNPCKEVKIEDSNENDTDLTKARWMELKTYKEFQGWLEETSSTPRYKHFEKLIDICHLAIITGMRREELCGLHWDKVSFENETISISETRVRSTSGVRNRNRVKTKSSYRTYNFTDGIRDTLTKIRNRQIEAGLYKEDGFVFIWEEKESSSYGMPFDPDYISKLFKKAIKLCPYVDNNLHFHHLRHSCCSILREIGWPREQVSAWLGHGGEDITKEVYDHYEEKVKKSSLELLNQVSL